MPFIKNTETKVKLANGQEVAIENLVPGNWVSNKDGFPENVKGYYFRSYKDNETAIKINNELICTSDQIFMGADGFYYVYDGNTNPGIVKLAQRSPIFIVYDQMVASRPFVGLPETLIKNLEVGVTLQTETGAKVVETLEIVDMFETVPATKDFQTDLFSKDISEINIANLDVWDYNDKKTEIVQHVIGNSATYIVNGYKCVSVPNNEWDYENQVPIAPETFEIIVENGRFIKIPR
jgi:hypothetical protein